MEQSDHEFFSQSIKGFKNLAASLTSMAAGFASLQNTIIEYDNKVVSLERQVKDLEAKKLETEKNIKELKIVGQGSEQKAKEFVNKRHIELIERESVVKAQETAVAEKQKKVDALLMQAEVAVSASSASPKRGRPAKEASTQGW